MKTADLTGAPLDYWVARAEGYRFWAETRGMRDLCTLCVVQRPGARDPWMGTQKWQEAKKRYAEVLDFKDLAIGFFGVGVPQFSTEWAQCGPLIDKHEIDLTYAENSQQRIAWIAATHAHGDTAQEAICRAVVRAAFGDEVPDA